MSKTPFQFPMVNLFRPIDERAMFYSYKLTGASRRGTDLYEKLLFKEYCRAGSGHPNGFTYGWVGDDAENLYVRLEFTPDNTLGGERDYAAVHVKTESGIKTYKVSALKRKLGNSEFTYTDKVDYQHKVYQFKIPLSRAWRGKNNKSSRDPDCSLRIWIGQSSEGTHLCGWLPYSGHTIRRHPLGLGVE